MRSVPIFAYLAALAWPSLADAGALNLDVAAKVTSGNGCTFPTVISVRGEEPLTRGTIWLTFHDSDGRRIAIYELTLRYLDPGFEEYVNIRLPVYCAEVDHAKIRSDSSCILAGAMPVRCFDDLPLGIDVSDKRFLKLE